MEYEIGDDPQGLPDHPDGNRDGGLGEDRLFFRKDPPDRVADRHHYAPDEDLPVAQLGEAA